MKQHVRALFILLSFLFSLSACGGGSGVGDVDPDVATPEAPAPENDELEVKIFEETDDGKVLLRVGPNVRSKEDLIAYRAMKITEAAEILESTWGQSTDKPYYPVVITMKRPIPLADFRAMLGEYNPSVAKALTEDMSVKYLPKASLAVNDDTFLADFIKFNSTVGHGRLAYETLTNESEVSKIEQQIAIKQKALNGVSDYQLVKGVTSVSGGVHRDMVMKMQDDPRVFLADIGPSELYEDKVDGASWRDIYALVDKYFDNN